MFDKEIVDNQCVYVLVPVLWFSSLLLPYHWACWWEIVFNTICVALVFSMTDPACKHWLSIMCVPEESANTRCTHELQPPVQIYAHPYWYQKLTQFKHSWALWGLVYGNKCGARACITISAILQSYLSHSHLQAGLSACVHRQWVTAQRSNLHVSSVPNE